MNEKKTVHHQIELNSRRHHNHTIQGYNPILQNQGFDDVEMKELSLLEIEEEDENKYEKRMSPKRSSKSTSRSLLSSSLADYSTIPTSDLSTTTRTNDIDSQSLSLPISNASHINHSPVFTSFVNLTSTIIGAGVLGIPYAFSRMGWILGTISIITCAFLSYSGLHLLAECIKKIDHFPCTFYTVAELAIPKFCKIIDLAIILKGIGVASSYLIVVTDSLPKAFAPFLSKAWNEELFENRVHCLLISYILVLPLSYLPHLESLKYSSLISLIMILFLVLLVFLYSLQWKILNPCESNVNHRMLLSPSVVDIWLGTNTLFSVAVEIPNRRLLEDVAAGAATHSCHGKRYFIPFLYSALETAPVTYHLYDIFAVFPIFLFSFTCHQNTYNIINELERPTTQRINRVFVVSILFTMTLFFIISYSAYFTFGDFVASDVLKSYPENNLTSLCRLFMSLVVISHYPLQLFAARKCALTLWQSLTNGMDDPWRFVYFTIFFNIITFILAVAFKDLGFTLSLLGTITSTLVILFLPPIFYLKLFPEGPLWKRNGCKLMFIFGWLVLFVSLTFNILNASGHGSRIH